MGRPVVLHRSLNGLWHYIRSGVIVFTGTSYPNLFKFVGKSTIKICLYHGMGPRSTNSVDGIMLKDPLDVLRKYHNFDYFNFTSKYTNTVVGRLQFLLPENKRVIFGLPRCDHLFSKDKVEESEKEVSSIDDSGRIVTVVIADGIPSETLVELTLSAIKNPPFTGDPQGGGVVTKDSNEAEIDQSIDEDGRNEACENDREVQSPIDCEEAFNWDHVTVDTITPGKLTGDKVKLDNKKAGGTGDVTITFRLDNPLPANGVIAITFPEGFVLSENTGAELLEPDSDTLKESVGVTVIEHEDGSNKTTALIIRSGSEDPFEADSPVKVRLTNIRSPQVSGQTHNFEIRTSVGN